MADAVMRAPTATVSGQTPDLQRLPYQSEDARLQAQPISGPMQPHATTGLPSLSRKGEPLPASLRAWIEPRFGRDFSDVRIHHDAQAAESARAVNARAYTAGRDIVFGAEEFAPETRAGQRLLAHELTHVVQQRAGCAGTPAIQRDGPASLGMRQPGSNPQLTSPIFRLPPGALEQILAQREAPIRRWLDANKSSARTLSLNAIVRRIYHSVPEAASMSRGEVAAAVSSWAMRNDIILPPVSVIPDPADQIPPAPSARSLADSEILSGLRDIFTAPVDGVKVERAHGFAKISVIGSTVGLRSRGLAAAGTVSWGGTMGIETSYRDFHFAGELSGDRWELSFSYPVETPAPDLSQLQKVFTEGESALCKIVRETASFHHLHDIPNISDAIHPYLQPVKEAVQAAQGIAGAQAGRVMFGVSASGPGPAPHPSITPPGFGVTATITIVF